METCAGWKKGGGYVGFVLDVDAKERGGGGEVGRNMLEMDRGEGRRLCCNGDLGTWGPNKRRGGREEVLG